MLLDVRRLNFRKIFDFESRKKVIELFLHIRNLPLRYVRRVAACIERGKVFADRDLNPFGFLNLLRARQRDGILEPFPIYRDICEFDGNPWRVKVDIISGGFPCQDISIARKHSDGINGKRSGLWKEMARVIGEVRPPFAFMENSPALVYRGLGTVLRDLSEMGYDAEWCVLGASAVGAPHHRERIWILAVDPDRVGRFPPSVHGHCDAQRNVWPIDEVAQQADACPIWQSGNTGLQCLADGFPLAVDQFRAVGNAQVPAVAATAFGILYKRYFGE